MPKINNLPDIYLTSIKCRGRYVWSISIHRGFGFNVHLRYILATHCGGIVLAPRENIKKRGKKLGNAPASNFLTYRIGSREAKALGLPEETHLATHIDASPSADLSIINTLWLSKRIFHRAGSTPPQMHFPSAKQGVVPQVTMQPPQQPTQPQEAAKPDIDTLTRLIKSGVTPSDIKALHEQGLI